MIECMYLVNTGHMIVSYTLVGRLKYRGSTT